MGVSELGGSPFVHEVVEFLVSLRAVKHAYSNRKMIKMISSSKEFMENYNKCAIEDREKEKASCVTITRIIL